MAVDDRFLRMFFEEARELLVGLEEGLLDLERRQGDRAHLDKTFRAAHSLKGAAQMVGLPGIAEFTHGIETVLDRIRSGSLAVESDVIGLLLEARDHLSVMVEAEASGTPVGGSPAINARIHTLLHGPSRSEPPMAVSDPIATTTESESVKSKPVGKAKASGSDAKSRSRGESRKATSRVEEVARPGSPQNERRGERQTFRIRVTPGHDLLRRGVNPLGVLDELRDLGACTVATDPDLVPPLDELDPERCFLTWTVDLETDAELERIHDVFLFLSEDSRISVERRLQDGGYELISGHAPPIVELEEKPSTGVSRARSGASRKRASQGVEAAKATPDAVAPEREVEESSASHREKPAAANSGGSGSSGRPAAARAASAAGGTPPGGAGNGAGRGSLSGGNHPSATGGGGVGPPGSTYGQRAPARIRVDAAQLDDLVGLAGELAVLSDNLQELREVPEVIAWQHTLESLERVSRQIRDTTLELRMVPVDELFSRFPRVVRDLADRFGKEIELRIIGAETRLDRTIVERLGDPMIHLIRNAVDHALETPQERAARGKKEPGRITLSAGHEGDRVAIRIEDNGRGLDRERIVKKGIALGMVPLGTSPDDPRVDTLIFEAGFSTRDKVGELSGRGVGLDVVRDAVRGLRGSLSVESTPGQGTSFIFRLPLTLALIDGLLVETAGYRYVVPLAQVEECVAFSGSSNAALSKGRLCVAVRGELIPMVPLRKIFQSRGEAPARQELLLTRHAGQRVGVAVDKLLGRVQAVIQSLGEGLHGLNRFSGATILGDGTVSLILDLAALVSESRAAESHTHGKPGVGVWAESSS